MEFNNAMFSSDYQNLESDIVFSIDNYTQTGEKPIGEDEYGNPIWPATSYTEIGKMVRDYKYCNKNECLNSLAEILVEYITRSKELKEFTALVSCPSKKLAPVVELAAVKLNMHSYDYLIKKKPFSMKKTLKNERSNKAKLIECSKPIPAGEKIILIDDIIETGATMQACRDALKKMQPILELKLLAMARTLLS